MNNPDSSVIPGPDGPIECRDFCDPPPASTPPQAVRFSVLRMLIAAAMVAVWMAVARLIVIENSINRDPDLLAWLGGAFFGGLAMIGFTTMTFGVWLASGEVEKLLKGDYSSWQDGKGDGDEKENPDHA